MDSDIRCVGPREMPAKNGRSRKEHCQDHGKGCSTQGWQLWLSAFSALACPLVLSHLREAAQDEEFPCDERQMCRLREMRQPMSGTSHRMQGRLSCMDEREMHAVSQMPAPLPPFCHTIWQTHHEAWAVRASRRKGAGCLKGKRMNIRLGQQLFEVIDIE